MLRFLTLALVGALILSACSTAKVTDDQRAQLLMDMGNGSLSEGDPTAALRALIEAEKLNPRSPEILHAKALALKAKHEYAAAISEVKKAIKLKPDYTAARNTLGNLLLDLGRYDEAIEPLEAASRDLLYAEGYKPLTNLGILYYRTQKHSRAAEYFERAIQSDPSNACIAHYYRGHLNLRVSRFSEAITDYTQATRRFCAGFAEAHLALGIAYERSGQLDLARRKFLDVQKRFPETRYADQAIQRLRGIP